MSSQQLVFDSRRMSLSFRLSSNISKPCVVFALLGSKWARESSKRLGDLWHVTFPGNEKPVIPLITSTTASICYLFKYTNMPLLIRAKKMEM